MEEISQLVQRYVDAVNVRDAEKWASCWADDSTWQMTGDPIVGKPAIVDYWKQTMAGIPGVIMQVHGGEVALDGEAGTGRWHVTERMLLPGDTAVLILSAYDDGYVRVDGKWLFNERRYEIFYRGPPDLTGEWTHRV